MSIELRPCPFCGKKEPVEVERYGDDPYYPVNNYQVVCNFNEGGCGSSSGVARTEKEAIELWNRRAEQTISCKLAVKDSDGKCLGYSSEGGDEPIEMCQQCEKCSSYERVDDYE